MFFSEHETYVMPAYPTEKVIDPTGAGDSFAGGMMGYLAQHDNFDPLALKTAMAYGILVASFNVEGFGLERLQQISRDDIEDRMAQRHFHMGDVRNLAHEGRIYNPPEWDLRHGQYKWRVEGKALDGRTLYVVFVVLGEHRVRAITIETPGR